MSFNIFSIGLAVFNGAITLHSLWRLYLLYKKENEYGDKLLNCEVKLDQALRERNHFAEALRDCTCKQNHVYSQILKASK